MKYIAEVNKKYLVLVPAESADLAQEKLFEYYGVREVRVLFLNGTMMSADDFLDLVQHREMVSQDNLRIMSKALQDARAEDNQAKIEYNEAARDYERIHKIYDEAVSALETAESRKTQASRLSAETGHAYHELLEKFGNA